MSESLAKRRQKYKIPKPIEGFMKAIADTPMDPNDPESITYAEYLAQRMWIKAISDDNDAVKWASMLIERTEGKVPNEHRMEDANKLVEQITAKMLQSGMGITDIHKTLEALGIDKKYLPAPDFVEGELVN